VEPTWRDRITPTAVGLVSRAWVIAEVERAASLDATQRERLIDALAEYEPPRQHGLRNNVIFWVGAIGAAMLADALGAPGWLGFVIALALFATLARALAVKALRWRLAQLLNRDAGGSPPPP